MTHLLIGQESVILARWLMGLTVALAAEFPEDEHAQWLAKQSSLQHVSRVFGNVCAPGEIFKTLLSFGL